jgi:hypothetical protein
VIIVDRLMVGGLRFVLDKIAQAVDAELDDEKVVQEELLAAQMRAELGEIDARELARTERQLLARLREIRARRRVETGGPAAEGTRVTGVEIEVDAGQRPPSRPRPRQRSRKA